MVLCTMSELNRAIRRSCAEKATDKWGASCRVGWDEGVFCEFLASCWWCFSFALSTLKLKTSVGYINC